MNPVTSPPAAACTRKIFFLFLNHARRRRAPHDAKWSDVPARLRQAAPGLAAVRTIEHRVTEA